LGLAGWPFAGWGWRAYDYLDQDGNSNKWQ